MSVMAEPLSEETLAGIEYRLTQFHCVLAARSFGRDEALSPPAWA
jgi:hypothetical protein